MLSNREKPAIQTWAEYNGTTIGIFDQELERFRNKLRHRRTVANSIAAEEKNYIRQSKRKRIQIVVKWGKIYTFSKNF